MISVIILAYNEALLIEEIIAEIRKQKTNEAIEILLADGGSTDQTVALAAKQKVKIINSRKGKAMQLNDGAKAASGDVLFFVHADMQFSDQTLAVIKNHINKGFDGGGFSNTFDQHNEKIKKFGVWLNFRFLNQKEQSDRGIFYGDNGIFVKKEVFEKLGGFKEIPIMEDYDFSVRMKKAFKVVKITEPKIVVSARRHVKAGFFKTRFQWVMIRKMYKWGVSPEWLANWYKDVR